MEQKSEWGNPNDFYMSFRCTETEFARNFVSKGAMKFNTPNSWVQWELDHGKGRGDLLEGSIAGCHIFDVDRVLDLNDKYSLDETIRFPVDQFVYFKRKRSMNLPCFCFYILKNSAFKCPPETGKQKLSTTIPSSYFRDFADDITPEQYNAMPEAKKPAIILIKDFSEFRRRVTGFLIKLGLLENEIIFTAITYYDFHQYGHTGWFDLGQKPPHELSFKDSSFEYQSEARIIINSDKQDIINHLTKAVIEIGPLDDISEKKDFYLYEGVRIELTAEVVSKL